MIESIIRILIKGILIYQVVISIIFFSSCTGSTEHNQISYNKSTSKDSIQLEKLRLKWNESRYQSPDSMLLAAQAIITFATEIKNQEAVVIGQNMLASYYSRIGDYSKAIELLTKGINFYPDNSKELAPIYNNLGNAYIKIGDFDKALVSHLNGLRIVELGDDLQRKSISLLNIGGVYGHIGDVEKSLTASEEAFDLANEHDFYNVKMQSAFQIAEIHLKNGNDSLALIFADSVISTATLLETEFGINKGRSIQSKVLMNRGMLEEALNLIRQSKTYYESNGNIEQVVLQSITEVSILEELGNYKEAETVAQMMIPIAKGRGQKEELWQLYRLLALSQEQQGSLTDAYDNHKKYKLYQDSVVSIEKNKAIEELSIKYETEKKEAAIKSLSQQAEIQALQIRQRNQAIVIGVIVFVLIIALLYFTYTKRNADRRRKQIELEQRFLRSQLNPHFISNALVAVQSSLLEKDIESAENYLTTFSRLMREMLENSRAEQIPIEDEVSMLRDYMEINKKRLKSRFDFSIEVDREIDQEFDTLPPMLIQPFVENAIEHGVAPKDDSLTVDIAFHKEDSGIKVTVTDNGGGFKETKLESSKESLSTQIIKERLALFNQSLKEKINLIVENWDDDNGKRGVKVMLTLPLN